MNKRWICALVIWMAAGIPSTVRAQPTPISACRTTISSSGSYVLTGNISNPDNSAPCLTVNAYFVSIDLAGFSINGTGGSNGIYVTKSYLNVSNGAIRAFDIGINANGVASVKLSNISVKGSFHFGARLGDDAIVDGCQFVSNGRYLNLRDGLEVGANALITHSIFDHNSLAGVVAGPGAVIEGSVATNNASHGFVVNGNATVSNNTAQANQYSGFVDLAGVNGGSVFTSNASTGNTDYGFEVSKATLTGNVAKGNGYDGFLDFGRSTLLKNTAVGNTGNGFSVGSAYAGSSLTGNSATGNTYDGFHVTCPTNLIGNTAYQNGANSETETGGPPACQKINNLFP